MRINRFILTPALFIQRAIVLLVGIGLVWLAYRWAIEAALSREHVVFGVITIYLLTSYILVPRLHRLLSRFYVPHHLQGRTRTGDGLLSDPINVAIIGSQKQLEQAFLADGWVKADKLTLRVFKKLLTSVLLKRSYPAAPASTQYVFGWPQDYSFQKEIAQSARKRHHIRVWKAPAGWQLPSGQRVDWLGATHRDVSVGLSYFTGQFMHRISPSIDQERTYLIKQLKDVKKIAKARLENGFFAAYKHRNGGGDNFFTDGQIAVIDLK